MLCSIRGFEITDIAEKKGGVYTLSGLDPSNFIAGPREWESYGISLAYHVWEECSALPGAQSMLL